MSGQHEREGPIPPCDAPGHRAQHRSLVAPPPKSQFPLGLRSLRRMLPFSTTGLHECSTLSRRAHVTLLQNAKPSATSPCDFFLRFDIKLGRTT